MKYLLLYIFLLIFSSQIFSQCDYSISNSRENIFIHTDKEFYYAGDTIWFKSYLSTANNPATTSTNYFIDLLDDDGKIISSKKIPIFNGYAIGNIALPDSLHHGFYFLQHYTNHLLKLTRTNAYLKPIAVINPLKTDQKYLHNYEAEYQINFFPESGNIINKLNNTIAFKALDQFGNGVPISGVLFSPEGDSLLTFKDSYNGRGRFSFIPEIEGEYYAKIFFPDGKLKKHKLPQIKHEGVLIRIAENSKGKIFQVLENLDDKKKLDGVNLLGIMYNEIVFNEPLKFIEGISEGIIPIKKLPAGILNILVSTKHNNVLASRSAFINQPSSFATLSINPSHIDFHSKSRNEISLTLSDTIEASISVSVIAMNSKTDYFNNNSIGTNLLMQNSKLQLKNIRVNAINGSLSTDEIDLQFLTELTEDSVANMKINDNNEIANTENYIQLKGKIFKEGTHKPVTDGKLFFLIQGKDSASSYFETEITETGDFNLDALVYEDSIKISYQYMSKKDIRIDLSLDNEIFVKPKTLNLTSYGILPYDKLMLSDKLETESIVKQKKYFEEKNKTVKVLSEVIVETRIKRPVVVINKKYTSGIYSSLNFAKTFDFINEPPQSGAQNVFDYLQGRIAGLFIDRKGATDYEITSSTARSITGKVFVNVYVNEVPVGLNARDVRYAATIPLHQIAFVKYLPGRSNNLPGIGLGGVLLIYTKKGDDLINSRSGNMKSFMYPGYSSTREFTNVEYTEKNFSPDKRQTLYWNPYVFITPENKEFRFHFYNCDNNNKYKIVVQGFTYDGRLIDFEKIIE